MGLLARFVSMNVLITTFIVIIYFGALSLALMVMLIQAGITFEVCSVGIRQEFELQLPYLNTLRWYIFIGGVLYLSDGYFLMDIILRTDYWVLNLLFSYHMLSSLLLSLFGIIWFVISVNRHFQNKALMRYHFGQLAWSITSAVIVATTAPLIRTIFDGIIWGILPMTTVAANDIFAFGFGKMFGKHSLCALSPKKTWEGYILSGIATIPFGYLLAVVLMKNDTLLCPTNTITFGRFECQRNELFVTTEYDLYGYTFDIEPFQIYNLCLSLWIAIVCPIGDLIASGYKRAFGLKDYGSIIPGHGGITDRMDAEVLICGFVYCLANIALTKYARNSEDIEAEIVNMCSDDQKSLYMQMLGKLVK